MSSTRVSSAASHAVQWYRSTSKKFTVETADTNVGKMFKQTWSNNMEKVGDPVVKDIKGDDFTKITFEPDLEKFNMSGLDKDTVALLNRRAFDIAACCKGVKVHLNGESVPVSHGASRFYYLSLSR